MGLELDKRPIVDVTAQSPIPLEQRSGKNLCAIHAVTRAWLVASGQYTPKVRINYTLVDDMRMLALSLLTKKNKKLCYKVTPLETLSNHMGPTRKGETIVLTEESDK